MKLNRSMGSRLWFVYLLLAASFSQAEDIDLFLGLPAGSSDAPNVLFIIDNTANWSQTGNEDVDGDGTLDPAFAPEMIALQNILNSLPDGEINVGIMLFTETGSPNNNVDGGYMRAAIRSMTTANKTLYANLFGSLDENGDKSNGGKAGLTMAEAYHYFAGLNPRSGNNKAKTDYMGNMAGYITTGNGAVTTKTASQFIYELPDNVINSISGSPYNSPVPPGYCGKNYIIWISNGPAQDNTSDSRTAEAMLTTLGGDITQIPISPSNSADNVADEWARFMSESALGITTFTIDVNKNTTGQGPGWSALLLSMANVSGGQYYDAAASVAGITGAVNDALSRILAVNSVFASVALPASANTQSTFLNQVYIGMFRPDENANPRWYGNLKQYKLGYNNNSGLLEVLDAGDNQLIDPDPNGTGFILECARSFWTPTKADSYWSFVPTTKQRGVCKSKTANPGESNYPDGPVVEKGGQAYRTRAATPSTRVVKTTGTATCSPGTTACSLTNFVDGNAAITQGMVNATSTADRTRYINWARGADTEDEDGDANTTEMRPSVHASVIHSQPVAIDYRADPNDPAVVVFYGGNDGLLRAVNGNRTVSHDGTSTGTGKAAGDEFWTFMPPEFYGQIDRVFDNTTVVKFPATGATAGASGQPKPYGVDGPITAYDGGATRYLYTGMRRGGRTIHAFDVSDINNPALKWRLGCTTPLGDDSGCAAGWTEVGQTWSPLTVAHVQGKSTPYIIMGGGYDDCDDYDDPSVPSNNACSGGAKGDVIYVLNGDTGAIEQVLPTDRPVPGAVTVVNISDTVQEISYAYAADTGGNVYRISGLDANTPIGSTVPAGGTVLPSSGGWTITKIAKLGCGPRANSTCTANRKFLFGPDVVRVPGTAGYAVLLGSGDREKPLVDYGAAASVQNHFFALFDYPLDPNWLLDNPTARCNDNVICMNSLTAVTVNGPVSPGASIGPKGWKLALGSGEQVVSAALTVADVVNFSTHIPVQPNATSCNTDLGTATTYNVEYSDGKGQKINITGGGLVPTPVAGKVVLDNGQIVPFCIGCGGQNSAIGGSQVFSGVTWSQPKSRVYWKIEK